MSTKEFNALIERVCNEYNINEKELTSAINYTPGYISQLRNKEKYPAKFISKVKYRFPLPAKEGELNESEARGAKITINGDIEVILSTVIEMVTAMKAAIKVLLLEAAESRASRTNRSFSEVSLELEKMTRDVEVHDFDELKSKFS